MWLTLILAVMAACGMELWARVVHRRLWHGPLWFIHASHHAEDGRVLEWNDLFVIAHMPPGVLLIVLGLSLEGILASAALGLGLGVSAFGVGYALVHDGFVHQRLPLGVLRRSRYLRRVRAAHLAHHHSVHGPPYGLFLGWRELQTARRRAPNLHTSSLNAEHQSTADAPA